jgi:periplasmic copper chaperone A
MMNMRATEMFDRQSSVAVRHRRAATIDRSTRLQRGASRQTRGKKMLAAPPTPYRLRIPAAACGLIIVALSWMASGSVALAGEETLKVVEAWVPATDKVGGDVPLLLTIHNEADAADVLLRVRCPVANFSEKHTIDRGEGAPAMRAIPSIPIAGSGTTVLKPDGYHVMLLQTRQPLSAGDRFTCSIAFQKAGTIETEVNVRKLP